MFEKKHVKQNGLVKKVASTFQNMTLEKLL